jgi:hypothetical protein
MSTVGRLERDMTPAVKARDAERLAVSVWLRADIEHRRAEPCRVPAGIVIDALSVPGRDGGKTVRGLVLARLSDGWDGQV